MKNALFITILFFAVGCGLSEKDLVGTWTGTVELEQQEENDKQTSFLQSALGAVTTTGSVQAVAI